MAGKHYQSVNFQSYSNQQNQNTDYQAIAHTAFQNITDFQKAAKEPLAIVVEGASCLDCEEVHQALFQHPEVLRAFKTLTVARLNADSDESIITPEGKTQTIKQWVAAMGVSYRPGVLLFDRGQLRAKIDNRLYSWHFQNFITWVSGRHYEKFEDVYEYMGLEREKRLAAGQDVYYVD